MNLTTTARVLAGFCGAPRYIRALMHPLARQNWRHQQTTCMRYNNVTGWLSGNAFVSGAVGLRFESRACQVASVFPTVRHRCNISSKEAVLPGRIDAEMGPAN